MLIGLNFPAPGPVRMPARCTRLQAPLQQFGIRSTGTDLFQWWSEVQAEQFWVHMAERGILVRLFVQAARGTRLGLPGDDSGWLRLTVGLEQWVGK